jgi:type I restriction enzyme M protein
MTNEQLVSKVWNYAHVLRDQGISYGDYVEQITYLLFLKMDAEREDLLARIRASRPASSGRKARA